MQVNVSQLLKDSIGCIREYDIKELSDVLGKGDKSFIEGKVRLTRTNRGILAQGSLQSIVHAECSRCLKPFEYSLNIILEEEFFPVIDVITGMPLEDAAESNGFNINEQHILDLNESIRQNALLATPMKPLCKRDCAGICMGCGEDLNEGRCSCTKKDIDPRWSKLGGLNSGNKKEETK